MVGKENKGEGRKDGEEKERKREGEDGRRKGGKRQTLLQSGIIKWQCNVQGCSAYVHLMSVMRHQDMRYC